MWSYPKHGANPPYIDPHHQNQWGNVPHLHSSVQEPFDRHGLPPGATSKPPPLTMVSSSTRTTATVTPLVNQPSPSNVSNAATNGNGRGSSFAAALRKLAKQAGDTEPGLVQQHPAPPDASANDLSPTNLSTSSREPSSSSAAPPPGGPKRIASLPPAPRHNSPPVVTIAPSSHHHSNNYSASSNEHRKSLERPSTGSSSSGGGGAGGGGGGHMEVKQEHKEERPRSKDHPHMAQHPSAVPANSSSAYEELAMRGFQPYRAGEDPSRQAAAFSAASAFPMDPALYSAYHSAFAAAPHPFSHPAFRFDDPMLLERYRMMQPPMYPYAPPGMMHGAPGLHSLLPPGVRYPAELLAQSPLHFLPGAKLPDHLSPGSADRVKVEDDLRREREKEEMERERERERERELQKEREHREKEERDRQEREKERRDRERRERQRHAERNAVSRPQEDPGGGRYAPRDMSMYGMNHLEKRLYPYAPPPPPVPLPPRKEDAEKERHLMHQQFLREQDLMLRETNAPTAKNNPDAVSSHKEPKPFHRPFEKTVPNGYNKEMLKVPELPPQTSSAAESRNFFDKKQHRHRTHELPNKEGSHPEFTYRLNSAHHKHHKDTRSLGDRPKASEQRVDRLKRPLLNGPPTLVAADSSVKVKNRSLTDMEGDAKRRKLSDAAAAAASGGADQWSALDTTQQLTKTPDYKKRINFLNALGLQTVNSQRRIELDFIRDVCDWDRQKRNGPKEGIKVPRLSMDPLGLLAPGSSSSAPAEKNTAAKDSREFSREFHASVLQATQQQQLRAEESSFKWPGIEALLEAYQRHAQEQGLEQHVLREQCARLKGNQRQLNQTAEQLSSRISELIQRKQQLEGDRQRSQSSLDSLKRPLRAVRR